MERARAIILAAGRGRRLGERTRRCPKCLLEVGGRPLLAWQLEAFTALGATPIVVVGGYHAGQVREFLGGRHAFVLNERFGETNSLYSLWLARAHVVGDVVVANGDVLAHREIYRRVVASTGSALAYDSSRGGGAEEMKVALRGGLVEALGKHLPPAAVHGENVGILRFEAAAAARLLAIASAWVRSGREREWVPAAVSQLARERPIAAHDIAGWPWTEIDFPEDLEDARHRIAPSLAPVREARLASETRR